MMGTVKDKLNLTLKTKGSIRAAISAMGQSVSDSDTFASYAAKIRAISSDATAAAGDILSGKTAYAGGKKITGTIASKGAGNLTASGATVSVPAGYYPSAVSKSVAATTQATPGISVDAGGLITASATQGAGYVAAGTKSATKQLTTQAAATITPGTTTKTAVAAGRYTTGAVTVAGDANLVAGNIKSGVSIFGVSGSLIEAATKKVTIINRTGKVGYISTLQVLNGMVWIYQNNMIKNGESISLDYVDHAPILLGSNSTGNPPTASVYFGNTMKFVNVDGLYYYFIEVFTSEGQSLTITMNP